MIYGARRKAGVCACKKEMRETDNEVAKKPVLVSRFSSLHLNGSLTHAVMLALILTLAS